MKRYIGLYILTMTLTLVLLPSCNRPRQTCGQTQLEDDSDDVVNIGGHPAQDTIIGNFTGYGLDSIWIVERIDTIDDWVEYNYHTQSNNSLLPSVELFGRSSHCAFIVNEGDVDGDGKDEWAWMRGNLMSFADIEYYLLHFDDNKWLEFSTIVDADSRYINLDIIKKGSIKGTIIVSSMAWPAEESPDKVIFIDTIVNPFQEEPMLSNYQPTPK